MLKLFHLASILFIQLSFCFLVWGLDDGMPPWHIDVADPRRIDSPEYHKGCLIVPIPPGVLPHRSGVSQYTVWLNTMKGNGVPALVMARNEQFRTWMITPVPAEAEGTIREVGLIRGKSADHDEIHRVRAQLSKKTQEVQSSEAQLIRYAHNSRTMPADLRVAKDVAMQFRSAQMAWMLARDYDPFKNEWARYQGLLGEKRLLEQQLQDVLTQVRERRMVAAFQQFDPAYHVPASAHTVLLWFHGMGTHVSSVLSLRSAVIQTLGLFRGTDLDGKIWPIGISLPGHGGPAQAEIQTLDQFIAWFDGLVEFYRAQGKKVILAGRSASGTLIMEYAMRYPEKLAGIIPFSHVWPDPRLQIDDDSEYMLRGPDKSLNLIADAQLLDWTRQFMVGCLWHRNLYDPALIRRLPPILMVHSWDDEEYRHRTPDGQWVPSMSRVIQKFSRYGAFLRRHNPRVHYLAFHSAWHNVFNAEDAHPARRRAFQVLRLFLRDPQAFTPELLGAGIDPLHIRP